MPNIYDNGGFIGTRGEYDLSGIWNLSSTDNRIVRNGLVFNFDAANKNSYPGSGTAVYDTMGNALAGETVNAPTFNSLGFFTFNGSTNYIRFPNSTALNSQTFSIEVWVKTNNTNQNGFWFEKGIVNTQYSIFQAGPSILCRINNGTTVVDTITLTTANFMNTTSWYQVVFTFTTGAQVCYINAVSRGTGTTSATVATNNDGMSIGVYGGYTGARAYYYNGSSSVVRVYNKVLTSTEVAQNFNATRGRFSI